MNPNEIDHLLSGKEPTLDEFAALLKAAEELSIEELWQLQTQYRDMNGILRSALFQHLSERVAKENLSNSMNSIASKLKEKLESK